MARNAERAVERVATRPAPVRRGPAAVRAALVDAAARLLPERAPSAITGRDLAAEAGVNYGLVHHYFGGKNGVLVAGLEKLRDDFRQRYGSGPDRPFLGAVGDPYLRALVRSQMDYPDAPRPADEFPGVKALTEDIARRLAESGAHGAVDASAGDLTAAATARTIAALSLQILYGVFADPLLAAAGVEGSQRAAVEAELGRIYAGLLAIPPSGATEPAPAAEWHGGPARVGS